MKIVLIGCNHAGTWAAKSVLANKTDKDELIIFERNDNTSFLGCGIALWVSKQVKNDKDLFYSSPEELEKLGAKIHLHHEMQKIDEKKKVVYIKDLKSGKEIAQEYDKLILGTGSWPIIPPFKGIDLKGIKLVKLYQHAQDIIEKLNNPKVKNVVVVGAGYIGVELAEAFDTLGKKVTFIERGDAITPNNFDKEISVHLEEGLKASTRIDLKLNESVVEFVDDGKGNVKSVKTDKGEYPAQMVIMSIGFRPNTKEWENTLKTTPSGHLQVNKHFKTSNKDIYGIGDGVAHQYNPSDCFKPIMLATNAVRSGFVAGINAITNDTLEFGGIQGTHAINVFGWILSGTGLTEEQAALPGCESYEPASITVEDNDKPEFMKNYEKVFFKVVYDKKTKKILGAQIASKANHAEVMYMISLAIQKGVRIDELGLVDTYFLPHLNKPINFITRATMIYLGLFK